MASKMMVDRPAATGRGHAASRADSAASAGPTDGGRACAGPRGGLDAALQFVPGLAGDQSQRIRDAVRAGVTGPILDIEEPDGSGVLISVD